ncbi:4-hydroxyphenylacetate 3-hydroxylase family protein [Paenibacillus dakarensis]|uniref:4-hydroxyphenylacetate 3-hydroxylase family protein n=1 Tax=Paenibacillus dakarensis TaxID=1527293 RepID=UPI0006D59F7F|nr:4-hydroxyphenylacetate 3-hydroxylase N-terminal domain-containing protein [Paenibacillus dakarensis]
MPIKTGKQYIERIDQQNINIWYKGKRISGPLSLHPAFKGLMQTQAALYDMQWDKRFINLMTYTSPDTGDPVGLSYLPPANAADLVKRRNMMELWSKQHHGFLGRSPDYMNTAIMSLYTAADLLEEHNPLYADNLRKYYAYCRENDITLSHAFIQPYASNLSGQIDSTEESIAAKVVEMNDEGMIISGAFLMATQGATCEEILVFPSPSPAYFEDINPFAFACAVPNNLPGMTFICRESYGALSSFDHPLSSRYEEMDTLVIFDHVLVPKDRIFCYGDESYSRRLFKESHFHTHIAHQIITRYIAKIEFLLGLYQSLAKEQDVEEQTQTALNTSKMMTYLEIFKALRLSSETEAVHDRSGYLVPASGPLLASSILFPQIYPEIIEMITILGSSGLIMIPSQHDFTSDSGPYLHQFLRGEHSEARNRVALFRLAWELGASAFGGRQTQFERFFFGNAHTTALRMINNCNNTEQFKTMIRDFITSNDPSPH